MVEHHLETGYLLIVNKLELYVVINDQECFISRIGSGQGDAFIQFSVYHNNHCCLLKYILKFRERDGVVII